jgi:aldehyde:ferredoxin oxidoreductase
LNSGGTRGNVFDLPAMLDEYYAVRGWDKEGIPAREKLFELGLEECL